jgi:uncharacterized membrane protein
MTSVRYRLLDTIRALAILNMVAYHLCYDLLVVYGGDPSFLFSTPAMIWERLICCTFILVSGMSLNLSRHACRRGLIVNACGLLITLATWLILPSEMILFGVLNLIGTAMILVYALRSPLSRIAPIPGAALSFGLFVLTYGVPNGFLGLFDLQLLKLPDFLYSTPYLAFFGFPEASFRSSDYFPLLPWIFLFLCGWYLWRAVPESTRARAFTKGCRPLDFIGRHSLLIYLIHQPVLFGFCYLIFSRLP